MKIISHRGNLRGREPERENHPKFIIKAYEAGFDIEIDVWYIDTQFYLGHDCPQYQICGTWLKELQDVLWCHAKNPDAFEKMLAIGLHCFWHETDRYTMTSRGIPWCYPKNYITGGITVINESLADQTLSADVLGVCTDYPLSWNTK